jgi:GNAT superfamily N-acetyltransferase
MKFTAQQVTIRKARLDDGDRLANLCNQLGYPTTPGQLRQRLVSLEESMGSVIYVAEDSENTVIGWIHACIRDLLVDDRSAEICGLVVDADHRGSGCGRLLLRAVEEWAVANNCLDVSLRSNVVRTAAHRFYEGLGYERIKTQHAFKKQIQRKF